MALKINRINETGVTGVLDNALTFNLAIAPEGMLAEIGHWKHKILGRIPETIGEMRAMSYEALARYREAQRGFII